MSLFSRLLHSAAPAWIEAEALARLLTGDAPPLLIDVRGADEFDGPLGHIEGALNLPLPGFTAHVAQLATQRRALVTVCRTDRRSAAAATQLRAAGAGNVAVLRGGMENWRAAGLP